jgi:hypothetical protein
LPEEAQVDRAYEKLKGTEGRLFADPHPSPEETSFQVDNTSEAYYTSAYYEAHVKDVQPVPRPRVKPSRMDLADVLGADILGPIIDAKRIAFHAVGDTGAAKGSPKTAILHEASVADAMALDVQNGGPAGPAFFFHLGDVVYHFGEAQYYYDQFYEPFRAYDRPIFAIPGNHDGMVFGSDSTAPQIKSLAAFRKNFCATKPGRSPDSGTLVRSTMNQPGVYFTLDAPFVSIVGLYTNVLEGPGVISSHDGKFPQLGNEQADFLNEELQRLADPRKNGERAVIVACHHPPVSVDSAHGGSTGLAADIDAAAKLAGFWPDAILSGHAHLYQRFTRKVDGREIPYVVAGSGGFSATAPQGGLPKAPVTIGEYTLVKEPIVDFGYLTVTVDLSGASGLLTIAFHDRTNTRIHDTLKLDLASGTVS